MPGSCFWHSERRTDGKRRWITSSWPRHLAFCLSPDHYEAVLKRCRSGGIEILREAFNSGARGQGHAACFLDPDGNHIEIKRYGGAGEPAE